MNPPTNPRLRADAAQRRLETARSRFRHDTAPLRAAFARHRAAWLVAGGLAGGLVVGMLPRRFWSRIGAVLGSAGGILARSVLTPMVVGAIVARDHADVAARPPAG
jgi:predicted lipid-binding transport protein (Tim44 family)